MDMQSPQRRQLGISLVEILISLTIGLLILSGVLQLYATSTQNASMVSGSSAIQEHVRFLFSRIENDVSNAGYGGCLNFKADPARVTSIIKQQTNPAFDTARFVTGLNDVEQNSKRFDELTLRFAGNGNRASVKKVNDDSFTVATTDSSQFAQGDAVVVGDCSSFGVFRVSNTPAETGKVEFAAGTYNTGPFPLTFLGSDSVTPTVTYLYGGSGAFRYYVDTSVAGVAASANCSATTPQYCALYRKSTSSSTADELIEGVESFDVEYGWRDATSGNLFFAAANNVPANQWLEIDRLRITTILSSPYKTPTNDGIDYLKRRYTRHFFFFNQAPGV